MTTTEMEALGEPYIRRPLKSGHCAHGGVNPVTGETGCERCKRNGGYQRANPEHEFQPCPHRCHYLGPDGEEPEKFECGSCGKDIIAVEWWPLDEDGDVRYSHIDADGDATGEECFAPPPKRDDTVPVDTDRDCTRCGEVFTPKGRERICPDCKDADRPAVMVIDDDLSEFEEEDDFSDLDDL